MVRVLKIGGRWLAVLLFMVACGSASRALVHRDDMRKVFPWPRGRQELTIRVQPKTSLAGTSSPFASYEQVAVTPQTTFFITDTLGQEFAYTPELSPIRRLVSIKGIEIRWPHAKSKAKVTSKTHQDPPPSGVKQLDEK